MASASEAKLNRVPSIQCSGVGVKFASADGQPIAILDNLDLRVESGKIVSLIGASGCGKSTLLRAIAGLQPIDSGSIDLDNKVDQPSTEKSRVEIGFVFQEPALLDWRNVWSNVALPFELGTSNGQPGKVLRAKIESLIESVALRPADYKKFPDQLSGGMKMRVALARALANDPTVLLFDEPFAALDDILRSQLNDLLLALWKNRSPTIVFVTHNIAEAIYVSHQIAVMSKGKISRLIDIDLPFPRASQVRSSSDFAAIYGDVSAALAEVAR